MSAAKAKRVKAKEMHSPITGTHWAFPANKESYAQMVEQVADECALEIVSAYTRGHLQLDVVNDDREDYKLARAALAAIGIKEPSK
jgi:hypothetical protein